MKSRKRKKNRNVQSSLKIRLLIIGITAIGTLVLSGCQETSMTSNTSSPNISLNKRIYTLAEIYSKSKYNETKTNQNNGTKDLYCI